MPEPAAAPPRVSVLIPTKDRPRELAEAIGSVLGNGFDDLEIIVSDDSPARTGEGVVQAIGDPRLRYFAREGAAGKPENWDYAARRARGDYIYKLDDDDIILPGFLARGVEVLERHPRVASVYTAYEIEETATGRREAIVDRHFFAVPDGIVTGEAYWRAVLLNEGGYPANQKTAGMFRRAAGERLNFYRDACEDFAFSAALGLEGDVAYVPEILFRWRKHAGNNVNDLFYTWQISARALDGLDRLQAALTHPRWGETWRAEVDRCRQALPLYYLHAALREQSRASAWRLWRQLRAAGAVTSPARGWAVLLAGSALPWGWRDALLRGYRASPFLQGVAQRILVK